MPIDVACECGAAYALKDELAGKSLKCPKCGTSLQVPGGEATGDPAFARDKWLLRQNLVALTGQKYYVWDEQGQVLLYMERPHHTLQNLGAILAGIAAGTLAAGLLGALAARLGKDLATLQVILVVLAGVSWLGLTIVVGVVLSAKRHLTIYRDDTKREPLLEVLQDAKWHIINATYTVKVAGGEQLATLHKNYLYDILRKRWYCYGPDGRVIATAKEDSIILSLLRRLLGPLFGLLRTNFVILAGDGEDEQVIGEFNRKFTLLDRYVLDLGRDRGRVLDRRVAVALGVMLDTGERR